VEKIRHKNDANNNLLRAANVMSTCGNGDMPPANIIENVVYSLALLFGCPFIVSVIGNIASLMTNVSADKRAFESKLSQVRQLLQTKEIPADVLHKVSFFYDYKFARTGGIDEEAVLSSLSKSLRESVQQHITGTLLSDVPCFDYLSAPAINKLVEAISTRSFLDGDELMVEGDVGADMFIIESGLVRVTNGVGDVVFAMLGPGSTIGESCFIKGAKRNATVTAVGYCDVFVLSRYDLYKVKDSFPDEFEDVIEHIKNDIARKSKENEQTMSKQRELAHSHSAAALQLESSESQEDELDMSEESVPYARGLDLSVASPKHRLLSAATLTGGSASKVAPGGDGSDIYSELDQSVDLGVADKPEAVVISQYDFQQTEENYAKQLMVSLVLIATLYNIFMIPLRIALPVPPIVYVADYLLDIVLLLDMFLNWTVWPVISAGRMLNNPGEIRKRYVRENLKVDVIARFPFDIFALFALSSSPDDALFALAILRIPKILLVLNAVPLMTHFEATMSRLKIPFFYVRIVEVCTFP
jgi:CRP-like cAMP-binding protein